MSEPKLPQSLTYLYCNDTYLTNLPELPSEINTIYCNQNPQLECLPFLPSKLRNLSIYNKKITCLPNSVSGIYINANSSLPFCGILDSNLQKAIAENCPTCFDDCMRINSTETQKVKSLNLSGKNIDKIMDLHFFPNLESIDISNNPVSCLSPLPNSVFSIKIDEEKVKCVSSENLNLKVCMVNIQSAPQFCMTDGFSKEAANIALLTSLERGTCIIPPWRSKNRL